MQARADSAARRATAHRSTTYWRSASRRICVLEMHVASAYIIASVGEVAMEEARPKTTSIVNVRTTMETPRPTVRLVKGKSS